MALPISIEDAIENHQDEKQLWQDIILQLNKDLALVGMSDIELKTSITPTELIEGLQQIFSDLMHDKTSNFILYHFDYNDFFKQFVWFV